MTKRLAIALVALLGVIAVSSITGCATPRHRDWRQAVKAGDYEYAYRDLFESWRTGTVEVKTESLRHAWRDPAIIAVARKDLASIVGPAADRHAGDLASLQKAIVFGPHEDRVDFARLVDRALDVDREIALAYERRVATSGRAPVVAARPAAPAATPQAPPAPKVAPVSKPEPIAKPEATPQPPSRLQPSRPDAGHAELLAKAAQAKSKAVWRCKGAKECDKAWAAAEAFVGQNADMRIQTVTANAIETYKPIVVGEIGLRVDRVPAGAEEAEMRLTVACRAGLLRQACPTAEIRIYSAFPAYIQSASSR